MQGEARTTEIPAGRGLDGTAAVLLVVTIVLGLAGARLLITGGRSAITGGILLLIGALAAGLVLATLLSFSFSLLLQGLSVKRACRLL